MNKKRISNVLTLMVALSFSIILQAQQNLAQAGETTFERMSRSMRQRANALFLHVMKADQRKTPDRNAPDPRGESGKTGGWGDRVRPSSDTGNGRSPDISGDDDGDRGGEFDDLNFFGAVADGVKGYLASLSGAERVALAGTVGIITVASMPVSVMFVGVGKVVIVVGGLAMTYKELSNKPGKAEIRFAPLPGQRSYSEMN